MDYLIIMYGKNELENIANDIKMRETGYSFLYIVISIFVPIELLLCYILVISRIIFANRWIYMYPQMLC